MCATTRCCGTSADDCDFGLPQRAIGEVEHRGVEHAGLSSRVDTFLHPLDVAVAPSYLFLVAGHSSVTWTAQGPGGRHIPKCVRRTLAAAFAGPVTWTCAAA
jgi:hypothetical protein